MHMYMNQITVQRATVDCESETNVSGDKAGERSNLCEETDLVDLRYYGIQYLTLEGTEHNSLESRQTDTDRQTDRQTDRHTDRQTDRQTHRQTDGQTDKWRSGEHKVQIR